MLLYSASADDEETVVCFLDLHEIGVAPKKIQKLVIDLLVSVHTAQSASEKAFKINEDEAENNRPAVDVELRYFTTCNTDDQCGLWGLWTK